MSNLVTSHLMFRKPLPIVSLRSLKKCSIDFYSLEIVAYEALCSRDKYERIGTEFI